VHRGRKGRGGLRGGVREEERPLKGVGRNSILNMDGGNVKNRARGEALEGFQGKRFTGWGNWGGGLKTTKADYGIKKDEEEKGSPTCAFWVGCNRKGRQGEKKG